MDLAPVLEVFVPAPAPASLLLEDSRSAASHRRAVRADSLAAAVAVANTASLVPYEAVLGSAYFEVLFAVLAEVRQGSRAGRCKAAGRSSSVVRPGLTLPKGQSCSSLDLPRDRSPPLPWVP